MAGNEYELCGCEESVDLRAALRAIGKEETRAWTLCGKAEVRVEALEAELKSCQENGQRLLLERDEALRARPRHLAQQLSDMQQERDDALLRARAANAAEELYLPSVERRVRVLEERLLRLEHPAMHAMRCNYCGSTMRCDNPTDAHTPGEVLYWSCPNPKCKPPGAAP